jgi:hypothetical protein
VNERIQVLSIIKIAPARAVLVVGVLAASVALAACGSSSNSSTTASASASSPPSSASASSGRTARRAALVACLKQHGVTLPNRPAGGAPPPAGGGTPGAGGGFPGGGGGFGGGNSKLATAFRACRSQLGFRGRPGGFRPSQATIQKFVACVRRHGYNLPNPNFSGHGSVCPANIRTNPKFQTASRACVSTLRPQGARAGGRAPRRG